MAGIELGEAYITVMPSMEGCTAAIEEALGAVNCSGIGKTYGSELNDGVVSMFAGVGESILSVLGSAVSAACNLISESLDGAIARVDTLNSFPAMMEAIGYSAADAQASIDKMSDAIQGMPTTLDQIVTYTQDLTMAFGDLELGTDVAIALTDGITAFGGSTADADLAIQQLTKMMASGTYDTNTWSSAVRASGVYLNEVAVAMLGAEANNQTLRQALQDGTITTEEFAEALVTLDQEGLGGISAIAETAQTASVGIGTSMENAKYAITTSMATIIQTINTDNGYIVQFFDNVKYLIRDIGSDVNDFAAVCVERFEAMGTTWKETGSISQSFCSLMGDTESSLGLLSNTAIETTASLTALPATVLLVATSFESMAAMMVKATLKATDCKTVMELLYKSFNLMCNPVNLAVAAIAALAAIFEVCWNSSDEFQDSIKSIMSSIGDSFEPVLETLGDTLSQIGTAIMPAVNAVFDILIDVFSDLFVTVGHLLEVMAPFVADVLCAVIPVVGDIIELVMNLLTPALEGIVAILDMLMPAINLLFEVIELMLTPSLTIFGAEMEVIGGIINVIADAMTILTSIVGGLVTIIIDFVTLNWADIPNVIESTFSKCSDAVSDMADTVTGKTKEVEEATDELVDASMFAAESMSEALGMTNSELEMVTQNWTESNLTIRTNVQTTAESIEDTCGNIVTGISQTCDEINLILLHAEGMSQESINQSNLAIELAFADSESAMVEAFEEYEDLIKVNSIVWTDEINHMQYTIGFYTDGTLADFEALHYGTDELGQDFIQTMAAITMAEDGQYQFASEVWDAEEAGLLSQEQAIEKYQQVMNECSEGVTADWKHLDDNCVEDYLNMQEALTYLTEQTGLDCDEISAMVDALGGSINNTFIDADGMLTYQGTLIMDSLGNGMKDKWNNEIAPWISSLNELIPNLKGPEQRDEKLLTNAGELIIGSLGTGMLNEWGDVEDILDDMNSEISNWGANVEPFDSLTGDLSGGSLYMNGELVDGSIPIYITVENMECNSQDDIEEISRELYRMVRRQGAMAA